MKSPNITSTIGRSPHSARPAATPTRAPSLIGVAITRSGFRVDSPRLTLNAPPYGSATSSPSRYTRLSSSNSVCRARLRFSTTRSAITSRPFPAGRRTALDHPDRLVDPGPLPGLGGREPLPERRGVPRVPVPGAGRSGLLGGARVVALAVRADPDRVELHHQRGAPQPDRFDQRHQLAPDRVDVVAVHGVVGHPEPVCPARDAAGQVGGQRGRLGDVVV